MFTPFHIKPSQLTNTFNIVFGIIGLLITPIFPFGGIAFIIALVKVIEVYCWKYNFHSKVMIESKGVFNVQNTEIHYYRIKSIFVEEPFWMRLFGLCNITIVSSDKFAPYFKFTAVPKQLSTFLSESTDTHRKIENVREFDMYHM